MDHVPNFAHDSPRQRRLLSQPDGVVIANLPKDLFTKHLTKDVEELFLRGETKACRALPTLELLSDVDRNLCVQVRQGIANLIFSLVEIDTGQ